VGSQEGLRGPFEKTVPTQTTGVENATALQAALARWATGRAPTVRPSLP